jgi:hypothetical protein
MEIVLRALRVLMPEVLARELLQFALPSSTSSFLQSVIFRIHMVELEDFACDSDGPVDFNWIRKTARRPSLRPQSV